MKKILTIIALTVSVLGFTSAKASSLDSNKTVLANLSFNKIEVHGNVELIVAQGAQNTAEVNHNYYAENAMLQAQDGVLKIASYKVEKMIVYVTAKNLQSIAAYDNAVVETDGKLSLIDLGVTLYNNATASLNLDTYATAITLNDNAKASITGYVNDYSLTYSPSASISRSALVADNINEKANTPAVEVKQASTEEVAD